ncbi:unnamed protein product [Gordionus sp. m RMFG-2023]|uniref:bridge-like lipid transfer protein family member 1 isoform X2 n=1 Tax=Gordionus sp. m RMFG-2023 TaxID=3053472 RepID=UPI0030DE77DB
MEDWKFTNSNDIPNNMNIFTYYSLYTVICILFIVWIIYALFFHSRITGYILTKFINLLLISKKQNVKFGSLSISFLSGKIMFRDVHIINKDFSARICDGYINFRWWIPLNDTFSLHNGYSLHRIYCVCNGLELFIFNRTNMYSKLATSYENMYINTSKKNTIRLNDASIKTENTNPNKELWLTFFPIMKFQVSNGKIVFGNHMLPNQFAISVEETKFYYITRPASYTSDPYCEKIKGKAVGLQILLIKNEIYTDNTNFQYEWPPIHMINDRLIIGACEKLEFEHYQDKPGFDVSSTDDYPSWGVNVDFVKNCDFLYGPWVDKNREYLYNFFFPTFHEDYNERLSANNELQPRLPKCFKCKLQFLDSYNNLDIIFGKYKKNKSLLLSFEKGSTIDLSIPFSKDVYDHVNSSPNSELDSLNESLNESHLRFELIKADLKNLAINTNLPYKQFMECFDFEFALRINYKRHFNDIQIWDFEIGLINSTLFGLYQHKSFITALLNDWSRGPEKLDILTFSPFIWHFKIKNENFGLMIFTDRYNYVNCDIHLLGNCLLNLRASQFAAYFDIRGHKFAPVSKKIQFSCETEQTKLFMHVPDYMTVKTLLLCLQKEARIIDLNNNVASIPRLDKNIENSRNALNQSESDRFNHDQVKMFWINCWEVTRLNFELIYTYYAEYSSDSNINNRYTDNAAQVNISSPKTVKNNENLYDTMDVSVTLCPSTIYLNGMFLNQLLHFKENYFGECQKFNPLPMTCPNICHDVSNEIFSHLDINIDIDIEAPRVYLIKDCLEIFREYCPHLDLENIRFLMTKSIDETKFKLAVSPFTLTVPEFSDITDTTNNNSKNQGPNNTSSVLFANGLLFKGRALFSRRELSILQESLEYGWITNCDIESLNGNFSPKHFYTLVDALNCIALTFKLSSQSCSPIPPKIVDANQGAEDSVKTTLQIDKMRLKELRNDHANSHKIVVSPFYPIETFRFTRFGFEFKGCDARISTAVNMPSSGHRILVIKIPPISYVSSNLIDPLDQTIASQLSIPSSASISLYHEYAPLLSIECAHIIIPALRVNINANPTRIDDHFNKSSSMKPRNLSLIQRRFLTFHDRSTHRLPFLYDSMLFQSDNLLNEIEANFDTVGKVASGISRPQRNLDAKNYIGIEDKLHYHFSHSNSIDHNLTLNNSPINEADKNINYNMPTSYDKISLGSDQFSSAKSSISSLETSPGSFDTQQVQTNPSQTKSSDGCQTESVILTGQRKRPLTQSPLLMAGYLDFCDRYELVNDVHCPEKIDNIGKMASISGNSRGIHTLLVTEKKGEGDGHYMTTEGVFRRSRINSRLYSPNEFDIEMITLTQNCTVIVIRFSDFIALQVTPLSLDIVQEMLDIFSSPHFQYNATGLLRRLQFNIYDSMISSFHTYTQIPTNYVYQVEIPGFKINALQTCLIKEKVLMSQIDDIENLATCCTLFIVQAQSLNINVLRSFETRYSTYNQQSRYRLSKNYLRITIKSLGFQARRFEKEACVSSPFDDSANKAIISEKNSKVGFTLTPIPKTKALIVLEFGLELIDAKFRNDSFIDLLPTSLITIIRDDIMDKEVKNDKRKDTRNDLFKENIKDNNDVCNNKNMSRMEVTCGDVWFDFPVSFNFDQSEETTPARDDWHIFTIMSTSLTSWVNPVCRLSKFLKIYDENYDLYRSRLLYHLFSKSQNTEFEELFPGAFEFPSVFSEQALTLNSASVTYIFQLWYSDIYSRSEEDYFNKDLHEWPFISTKNTFASDSNLYKAILPVSSLLWYEQNSQVLLKRSRTLCRNNLFLKETQRFLLNHLNYDMSALNRDDLNSERGLDEAIRMNKDNHQTLSDKSDKGHFIVKEPKNNEIEERTIKSKRTAPVITSSIVKSRSIGTGSSIILHSYKFWSRLRFSFLKTMYCLRCFGQRSNKPKYKHRPTLSTDQILPTTKKLESFITYGDVDTCNSSCAEENANNNDDFEFGLFPSITSYLLSLQNSSKIHQNQLADIIAPIYQEFLIQNLIFTQNENLLAFPNNLPDKESNEENRTTPRLSNDGEKVPVDNFENCATLPNMARACYCLKPLLSIVTDINYLPQTLLFSHSEITDKCVLELDLILSSLRINIIECIPGLTTPLVPPVAFKTIRVKAKFRETFVIPRIIPSDSKPPPKTGDNLIDLTFPLILYDYSFQKRYFERSSTQIISDVASFSHHVNTSTLKLIYQIIWVAKKFYGFKAEIPHDPPSFLVGKKFGKIVRNPSLTSSSDSEIYERKSISSYGDNHSLRSSIASSHFKTEPGTALDEAIKLYRMVTLISSPNTFLTTRSSNKQETSSYPILSYISLSKMLERNLGKEMIKYKPLPQTENTDQDTNPLVHLNWRSLDSIFEFVGHISYIRLWLGVEGLNLQLELLNFLINCNSASELAWKKPLNYPLKGKSYNFVKSLFGNLPQMSITLMESYSQLSNVLLNLNMSETSLFWNILNDENGHHSNDLIPLLTKTLNSILLQIGAIKFEIPQHPIVLHQIFTRFTKKFSETLHQFAYYFGRNAQVTNGLDSPSLPDPMNLLKSISYRDNNRISIVEEKSLLSHDEDSSMFIEDTYLVNEDDVSWNYIYPPYGDDYILNISWRRIDFEAALLPSLKALYNINDILLYGWKDVRMKGCLSFSDHSLILRSLILDPLLKLSPETLIKLPKVAMKVDYEWHLIPLFKRLRYPTIKAKCIKAFVKADLEIGYFERSLTTDLLNNLVFIQKVFMKELNELLQRLTGIDQPQIPKFKDGKRDSFSSSEEIVSQANDIHSYLYEINLKLQGLQLTASTPTNIALRLETSAIDFKLFNQLMPSKSSCLQKSFSGVSKKRFSVSTGHSEADNASTLMDEIKMGRIKSKFKISASLGQMNKNLLYEEADVDYTTLAHFNTSISMKNTPRPSLNSRFSNDPCKLKSHDDYNNDPKNSENLNSSQKLEEKLKEEGSSEIIMVGVQRPHLNVQALALDKAILIYINYKTAYEYWNEQRAALKRDVQLATQQVVEKLTTPLPQQTPKALSQLFLQLTIENLGISLPLQRPPQHHLVNNPLLLPRHHLVETTSKGSEYDEKRKLQEDSDQSARFSIEDNKVYLVLTIENSQIFAYSKELFVCKGIFSHLITRFSFDFDPSWDDWSPNNYDYYANIYNNFFRQDIPTENYDNNNTKIRILPRRPKSPSNPLDAGSLPNNAIDSLVCNSCYVKEGTYEVCSNTFSTKTKNPKWVLHINWNMKGVDFLANTYIGICLKNLIYTLTILTKEELKGDEVLNESPNEIVDQEYSTATTPVDKRRATMITTDKSQNTLLSSSAYKYSGKRLSSALTSDTKRIKSVHHPVKFSDDIKVDHFLDDDDYGNEKQREDKYFFKPKYQVGLPTSFLEEYHGLARSLHFLKQSGASPDQIKKETEKLLNMEAQVAVDYRQDMFKRLHKQSIKAVLIKQPLLGEYDSNNRPQSLFSSKNHQRQNSLAIGKQQSEANKGALSVKHHVKSSSFGGETHKDNFDKNVVNIFDSRKQSAPLSPVKDGIQSHTYRDNIIDKKNDETAQIDKDDDVVMRKKRGLDKHRLRPKRMISTIHASHSQPMELSKLAHIDDYSSATGSYNPTEAAQESKIDFDLDVNVNIDSGTFILFNDTKDLDIFKDLFNKEKSFMTSKQPSENCLINLMTGQTSKKGKPTVEINENVNAATSNNPNTGNNLNCLSFVLDKIKSAITAGQIKYSSSLYLPGLDVKVKYSSHNITANPTAHQPYIKRSSKHYSSENTQKSQINHDQNPQLNKERELPLFNSQKVKHGEFHPNELNYGDKNDQVLENDSGNALKTADLYIWITIKTFTKENKLDPHILDFIEAVLEPIPMDVDNKTTLQNNKMDMKKSNISNASEENNNKTEENSYGPSNVKSESANTTSSNVVYVATTNFPVNVFVYLRVNPSSFRFSCLPMSRVECVIYLPSLDLIFTSKAADSLNTEIEFDEYEEESDNITDRPIYLIKQYSHSGNGVSIMLYLSKFSLEIFHPFGGITTTSAINNLNSSSIPSNLNKLSEYLKDKQPEESPSFSSKADKNEDLPGVPMHYEKSKSRKKFLSLEIDYVQVNIMRKRTLISSKKKFKNLPKNCRASLTFDSDNQQFIIYLSGLCDFGSASFKYDMRRLNEILVFPKAWYRKSIAKRIILGEHVSSTSSTTNINRNVSDKSKFLDKPNPTNVGNDLSPGSSNIESSSLSSSCENSKLNSKILQMNKVYKKRHNLQKISKNKKNGKDSKANNTTSDDIQPKKRRQITWESLLVFSVRFEKVDIQMNMGNVMGNVNWNSQGWELHSRIYLNSDHKKNVLFSFGLKQSVLDAKSGIVGGDMEMKNFFQTINIITNPYQILTHDANAMLVVLQIRMDYMGSTILIARISHINASIKDELDITQKYHYDHRDGRDQKNGETDSSDIIEGRWGDRFFNHGNNNEQDIIYNRIRLHNTFKWDHFQLLICQSTQMDLIKMSTKIKEFFQQQFQSSVAILPNLKKSLKGSDYHRRRSSDKYDQTDLKTGSARMALSKAHHDPIKSDTREEIKIKRRGGVGSLTDTDLVGPSTEAVTSHYGYWVKIRNLIQRVSCRLLVPIPDTNINSSDNSLLLGGSFLFQGNHLSLACFYGINFRAKTWAIFSMREISVIFSSSNPGPNFIRQLKNVSATLKQEGTVDEVRCREAMAKNGIEAIIDSLNITQNILFQLGLPLETIAHEKAKKIYTEMAIIMKITRSHYIPPKSSTIQEWCNYAFYKSSIDDIESFPFIEARRPVIIKDFRNMSAETIFSLPRLQFNVKSEHKICHDIGSQASQTTIQMNIEYDFLSEFENHILVSVDAEALAFLHDLIISYTNKNYGLQNLSRKSSTTQITSSDISDMESFQANDFRKFICRTWRLEPTLRIISWKGQHLEAYGVDYILHKLGFTHARLTIPKWIQRAAMDPLDKFLSMALYYILTNSDKFIKF